MPFLDKTGLTHLWNQILAKLNGKAEKTELDALDDSLTALSEKKAGYNTLGLVKTSSSVSTPTGYTSCPIIDGVPLYQNTNTVTKLRLPVEDITEVNLTTTAKTGEIVLGNAATKAVTNNTSTSAYLSANTNTVPTCSTLYNFVQVSMEQISTTIPSGSYAINVVLDNPATKNEILVPVGSSDYSYYISLHNSSGNNYYADSITFRRTTGTSPSQAMTVTCWLMRLKVMKY